MHDCVGCGCACYCHGDIDDCSVETVEYSWMHCETCGCSEDEVFEDSDDDWDEPRHQLQPEPQRGRSDGTS